MSTRELASLILLGLALLVLMCVPRTRRSLGGIVTAFVPILPFLAIYAAWVAVCTFLASHLNLWGFRLWEPALLKETFVWFIISGVALLFYLEHASTEKQFFFRTALDTVRVTVFVEFYLNLVTFNLFLELLLQLVLFVLLLSSLVASRDENTNAVKRAYDFFLALLGFGLLTAVGVKLFSDWHSLASRELLRSFLLPIWLTIGALL